MAPPTPVRRGRRQMPYLASLSACRVREEQPGICRRQDGALDTVPPIVLCANKSRSSPDGTREIRSSNRPAASLAF